MSYFKRFLFVVCLISISLFSIGGAYSQQSGDLLATFIRISPDSVSPEFSSLLKGKKRIKNVLLLGSPTGFSVLARDSALSRVDLNKLDELEISVKITDSSGGEFDVGAIGLKSASVKEPLIIQTDPIPEDIAEGQGRLSLVVNDEIIGGVSVLLVKTIISKEDVEDFESLAPQIESITTIRTQKQSKSILKLIIGGFNFHGKTITINGTVLTSKRGQLVVSVLPGKVLRSNKGRVLNEQEVIISKSAIRDKKAEGMALVAVSSPFGVIFEEITVPICKGQCGE